MARGRHVETPTNMPAKGWKDILFRVKDEIAEDRVGLVAAGVAFYGLMALFPAITAMIAISGLIIEPNQILQTLEQFSGLVPDEVMTIIVDQATSVAGSREGGLGLAALVGILIAIYSASKGMASLIEGMNIAYDEVEQRGFFLRTTIVLGLTLLLIFGLIFGLSATLAIPAILAFVNLGVMVETVATIIIWIVLLALTIFGISMIYRFGPSRDAPEWRWASAGAVIATILWITASAGFAFYVSKFGSYNESFGTLAGAVVLLMWFWISAYVIMFGAELNAELEAQTRYDTTQGAPQPMGRRDAQKADKLGEAHVG